MFRTAILAASAAAILTASGCTAVRSAANEVDQSAPAITEPAETTPASRPACQGDVVRIDWYAEGTDCDVVPPQRLDLVFDREVTETMQYELEIDCENHGGVFRPEAEFGPTCEGIDY